MTDVNFPNYYAKHILEMMVLHATDYKFKAFDMMENTNNYTNDTLKYEFDTAKDCISYQFAKIGVLKILEEFAKTVNNQTQEDTND